MKFKNVVESFDVVVFLEKHLLAKKPKIIWFFFVFGIIKKI